VSPGTVLPKVPDVSDSSYLTRLPKHARRRGSADKGEIEIVTSKKRQARIAQDCADALNGSALGKGGKRIGILLEDEVRMYVRDALAFPSGETKCEMRVIGKTEFDGPNGVAALCVLDGKFLIREIFRHATRSWELETVRGRRETGMTSRQAMQREIKQELGYGVRRMKKLGQICPDSAVLSTTLDLFFAELVPGDGHDDPEGSEAFGRKHHLSASQLAKKIQSGVIRDSYTVAAFLLAQMNGLIGRHAR
jgi:8-oxo-dGTP pyrophosphatase MutT (NUDIX family)